MRRRRRYSDELYHFGIKGMKWGVRKDRNQKAYSRARRLVDRADRGKSPLMSLARKLGKARANAGWHSPRDKKIIKREQNTLSDSLLKEKARNDRAYLDAKSRSTKASRAYDRESAKYVQEGFPKSREKNLRSLGLDLAKADGDYEREWRRIIKESRDEAKTSINKKYGVSF